MPDFQSRKFTAAIQKYMDFERLIASSIQEICGPYCTVCSGLCCREEICRESLDSIWLRMVRTLNGHDVGKYSDSEGWLTNQGCALETGRPPICYEFTCTRVLEEFEGSPLKIITEDLGNLINLVGKNIHGRNHLVTLTTKQELQRINLDKLIKALDTYSSIAVNYKNSLRELLVDERVHGGNEGRILWKI
ncbi:MAG: hypothetical protein JRD68_08770 [Deltaproteobacteria bacterium]|nr:hypothetical protein [Deltaproteobacteria bacterium]